MLKALSTKSLRKLNFFLILKRLRRSVPVKTPCIVSCSQLYNCFDVLKVECFLFLIQHVVVVNRESLICDSHLISNKLNAISQLWTALKHVKMFKNNGISYTS